MAAPEVDRFGKLVVSKLRDAALDFFDGLTRGLWKSSSTRQLQSDLAELTAKQRQTVRRCVIACLDTGIHDFLFALGQANDFGDGITFTVDGKNVAEASDGLHGESYGEDGWIAKFGKHPQGHE